MKHQGDIDQNTASVATPAGRLLESMERTLFGASGNGKSNKEFSQVRISLGDVDPHSWIREQPFAEKFIWQDRSSGDLVAGVGIADEIKGASAADVSNLPDIISRLKRLPGDVRYFGGMRFDLEREPADSWQSFGAFRFFLPRFEVRKRRNKTDLVVNLLPERDALCVKRIEKDVASLVFPLNAGSEEIPLPVSRQEIPALADWRSTLMDVLNVLESESDLQKIVLARQVEFQFAEKIDRFSLFKLLSQATPHCYHFLFQFEDERAFIGASPERLYRRLGRRVESEAVAGTGLRDDAQEYDAFLGKALLTSDKNQREHAYVRSSILDAFNTLCSSQRIDSEASLMNLSMGRHLHSKFEGVLEDRVTDIDVLFHLPPTSAVGGHPRDEALRKIRDIEPFDRGWYAGTVGWISRDAADFAVAIRSGLVSDDCLTLFSGAGIVIGSEPDWEWAEIEQKIGDFIIVLGLDQKSAKY